MPAPQTPPTDGRDAGRTPSGAQRRLVEEAGGGRQDGPAPGAHQKYRLLGPELRFEVIGTPVQQGSLRSFGKGRPTVHDNAKDLKPWRDSVVTAARVEMGLLPPWRDSWPLTGPVAVDATFTVRKPKSAPKRRRTWPDRRPDLDKLVRAVLDALTIAGAIEDDAQVVQVSTAKVYPGEHVMSLDVPGVIVYLYRVGEAR